MNIRYDEKGKYFTDVIPKKRVSATIQTVKQLVQGIVYVHPEKRLKDELAKTEKFLAVTDAKILDDNGKILYETDFLAINIDQVIWIYPYE
ncbi:MAG TPA: hypothetical protein G4N95_00675 [Anaerolineae bacterium]|nr:hypothetical protein [Anaerolineae bacterium]